MADRVVVYGIGARFDRRFGPALRVSGYITEAATKADAEQECPVIVSYLDGEPERLPDLDRPQVAARCIWISDHALPEFAHRPKVRLKEGDSAEELIFHIGGISTGPGQRRREERHLASIQVGYRVRGKGSEETARISRLTNLSLGGAFVRSLDPPAEGTPVQLEFELSHDRPPMVLNGRVVYRLIADLDRGVVRNPANPDRTLAAHPGFAVAFDGSSFETRSLLQRFLREIDGEFE